MKHRLIGALFCALLLTSMLTACSGGGNSTPSESASASAPGEMAFTLSADSVTVNNVSVPVTSRGVEIPAVLTLPKAGEEERVPLVVLHHGHGGSKSENGGFDAIANALAEHGIATIRMDFPGCGDSTESFRENCLFAMAQDSNAALAYAVENAPIDPARIGAFGYSMGGRVVIDGAALDDSPYKPYKAVSLLAPSADSGKEMMVRMFGGEEAYESHRAEAFSERKYTDFTTEFGQQQELSLYWFDDLLLSDPLEAVTHFDGPVQVIAGSEDTTVPASVTDALIDAVGDAEVLKIEGANHGFGFYDDNTAVTRQVVDAVVAFFTANL